jgi:hypothetical protein
MRPAPITVFYATLGVFLTLILGLSILLFTAPSAQAAPAFKPCTIALENQDNILDLIVPNTETTPFVVMIRKTGDCQDFHGAEYVVKNQDNATMAHFKFDGTDTFVSYPIQYPGLYQAWNITDQDKNVSITGPGAYFENTHGISVKYASSIALTKHTHKGKRLTLGAHTDYYNATGASWAPWAFASVKFQYRTATGWKTFKTVVPNIKGDATLKAKVKGQRTWRVITVGTSWIRGHHTDNIRF